MTRLFDYIYFRIYTFFKERGDDTAAAKGAVGLAMLQCFFVLDVMIAIKVFIYDYRLPGKSVTAPFIILLLIYNWYKYDQRTDISLFEQLWKNEEVKRRIRNGWLISGGLILELLLVSVYVHLKFSLKVI